MKTRLNKKYWFLISLGAIIVLLGEGAVIIFGLAWYWAVAVFVIAFICLSIVGGRQEKQRVDAYFAGRPTLGEAEFGGYYFPADRAEIANKLRKILANHVGVDLSRMNPTDRFIEDLRWMILIL